MKRISLLICLLLYINAYSQENNAHTSLVSFPFHISLKSLNKDITESIGIVFYRDTSLTDNNNDQLQLLLQRTGSLKLSHISKGVLKAEIPVKLWIKKGVGAMGFYKYGTTTVRMHLSFKIVYSISSDWKLKTRTSPNGFKIINEPTLRISGMSIPIKTITEKILEYSGDKIADNIDKQIADNVNLKQNMIEIWNELSKPIMISDTYNTWMILKPIQIYSTLFSQNKDEIFSTMGLRLKCLTIIGEKPSFEEIKDIPDLKYVKGIGNNFKLYTKIVMPYTEINSISRKMMLGQVYEFNDGRKKIEIQDIEVTDNDDKTKIKVSTSGSYNGDIYLNGIPSYDTILKTFYMREVELSMRTKNILHKTAGWIFNGFIEKKIEQSMTFELSEKLDESKKEIEASMNKKENGITTSCKIFNIDVKNINNDNGYLLIDVVTKGSLSIKY